MWFTDCLLGIGMCTMTDCMLMRFLLTPTDYGGIGALTILTDRVGDSVGDGAHRGITAVGIQITGMAATGAAVIGDIILGTTIIIPATVGAAATGGADMDGMVPMLIVRAFMPADITTIITRHARTVIIT